MQRPAAPKPGLVGEYRQEDGDSGEEASVELQREPDDLRGRVAGGSALGRPRLVLQTVVDAELLEWRLRGFHVQNQKRNGQ